MTYATIDGLRVLHLRHQNPIYQARAWNYCQYIRIDPYPDLTVGGGKAGLISEPTLYLLERIV
jgi:hypothetical protein